MSILAQVSLKQKMCPTGSIGWVGGAAFAYHFVLQLLLAFLFAASNHPVQLPVFDMTDLYTVLGGLLGLGSLRTN